MRSLLRFFLKYFSWVLFVVLEIIGIVLIVRQSNFHQAAYFNASGDLVGRVYQSFDKVSSYLSLKQKNESLAQENALLQEVIANNNYRKQDTGIHITDSMARAFHLISAKVISNSVNKMNNYIIINKGSAQGIEKKMGVFSDKGIVGVVKDVSKNYAAIMSILHKETKVSIKTHGYFGSLIWEGYDATHATVPDIPKHVKLAVGDTIFTSGFSAIFPEKLMVGTIEKYEIKEGSNFFNIKVRLAIDFYHLDYVYIIQSLDKNELDSLRLKIDAYEN